MGNIRATKEEKAKAFAYGREAAESGQKCIPAWDKRLMELSHPVRTPIDKEPGRTAFCEGVDRVSALCEAWGEGYASYNNALCEAILNPALTDM